MLQVLVEVVFTSRAGAVVRTDCVARTRRCFFCFTTARKPLKCTGVSHCCDYPSHRLADTSSPSLACCYEAYAIYTYEPLLMSLTAVAPTCGHRAPQQALLLTLTYVDCCALHPQQCVRHGRLSPVDSIGLVTLKRAYELIEQCLARHALDRTW